MIATSHGHSSPTASLFDKPMFQNHTVYVYGLMALGWSLCFVRLNHVAEYLFVGLAVVWLAQKWRTRDWTIVQTSLAGPIALLFAWMLVTVPFATDPSYSLDEWRKMLTRVLLFFFAANVVRTVEHVRLTVLAIAAGVGMLSVLEVWAFFAEGGQMFQIAQRAGALTGSSQWLSNYVVIGWPIVWLAARGLSSRGLQAVALVLLAATLFCAVVAMTRGAWVAMGVQVFVYAALRVTKNGLATGLLALCLVSLVLGVIIMGGKKGGLFDGQGVSSSYSMSLRFNTWSFATEQLREHGMVGIGYGKHSFQKAFPDLGVGYHRHIHNMFLGAALQVGILGVLLLFWVFVKILEQCCLRFRDGPQGFLGQAGLLWFVAVSGLMVRNVFDDMFIGTIASLFFLVSGLVCSGVTVASKNRA